MRALKRLVITSLEIAAEAISWGFLLGVLTVNHGERFSYVVMGSILAIPVTLFLYGYYFTRILAGMVLRIGGRWLYPAIAATIFVIHALVLLVRLKPDLSVLGKVVEPPFLVGGAFIVFACAVGGNWLLRKWTHTSNGPSPQHREIVPGSASV